MWVYMDGAFRKETIDHRDPAVPNVRVLGLCTVKVC